MDIEDFHKEPSEEHENEEYFEKESPTASISYDVEVDQGNIQFEIHRSDHSSDSDDVAEGLEERNYLEETQNQMRRVIVGQKRGLIVEKIRLIVGQKRLIVGHSMIIMIHLMQVQASLLVWP